MGLVDRATPEKRDIPHEPGEWIEFKPVAYSVLRSARKLRQREAVELQSIALGAISGELMTAIEELREGKTKANEAAAATGDPSEDYDVVTVLSAAIAGWSYPEKVARSSVEKLDEPTSIWAVRTYFEIYDRSRDEGNESTATSSPSTGTSTRMESKAEEAAATPAS